MTTLPGGLAAIVTHNLRGIATIANPARLAALAIKAQQAGEPWTARLLLAPSRDEATVCFVTRGCRTPARTLTLDSRHRPVIVVIGDDDPAQPNQGPAAFPSVWRAFAWAAAVVLHAAGGTEEHAEQAIAAAAVTRKLLVVECGTAGLGAWLAAADRYAATKARLIVKPRRGLPHPIATAPAGTVFQ